MFNIWCSGDALASYMLHTYIHALASYIHVVGLCVAFSYTAVVSLPEPAGLQ